MDALDQLTALFERFPGVGSRQARRFVHYLLRASPGLRRELALSIQHISNAVHQCPECMQFHAGKDTVCLICKSSTRDTALMMVVASDADLATIEHSGTYSGTYFVLGGTMPLNGSVRELPREKELLKTVQARIERGTTEIILALPANPEGDLTAEQTERSLESLLKKYSVKVTTLGRGLSTGSELEYADPDTIRNALTNRN